MKIKHAMTVLAVCTTLPAIADAAPLEAGTYEIYDIQQPYGPNVSNPPLEYRSLWGPNDDKLVEGGTASRLWSFSDGELIYDGLGGGATLSATATNIGDAQLIFDVNMTFSNSVADGRQGFCDFYGGDTLAGTGADEKVCRPEVTVDDDWTYLTYVAGTFTGVGNVLGGLVWDVYGNETHFPQMGVNGNALVLNGLPGFSMWFTYDQRQDVTARSFGGVDYTINDEGWGDINANLSDVPLPGSAWLMLCALGAGAVTARKRRKFVPSTVSK